MANYQDDDNCRGCGESLNTENEKDMELHEGCDPIDKVSGARLPLCDKVKRDIEEARERAMWLAGPDGQGG